jgi:hypothetical protein
MLIIDLFLDAYVLISFDHIIDEHSTSVAITSVIKAILNVFALISMLFIAIIFVALALISHNLLVYELIDQLHITLLFVILMIYLAPSL